MGKISDERGRLLIRAIARQVLDSEPAGLQRQAIAEVAEVPQLQAGAIYDLAGRVGRVDLGKAPAITLGSPVSITAAATKRWVLPLAGVKPGDLLWAQPDEYLPDGYGLPQAICRNAGQIEIRIAVPTLAIGATKTITLAITALR